MLLSPSLMAAGTSIILVTTGYLWMLSRPCESPVKVPCPREGRGCKCLNGVDTGVWEEVPEREYQGIARRCACRDPDNCGGMPSDPNHCNREVIFYVLNRAFACKKPDGKVCNAQKCESYRSGDPVTRRKRCCGGLDEPDPEDCTLVEPGR
jgi:hypothetical protein